MYRLLLTLIYLALTVIGAVVVYLAVDDAMSPLDERLVARVQGSQHAYQAAHRLRSLQMRDAAVALAGSDLGAYLGMLEDNREAMLRVEAQAYEKVPRGAADEEEAHKKRMAFVAEQGEYLKALTTSLADRLEALRGKDAWATRPREQLEKDMRDALVSCNAHAVSNCFFRLSYFPLKAAADKLRNDPAAPLRPDLVVVTDDRGTGLADADQPRWSDDPGFSERYPLIRKTREGVVVRDVIQLQNSERYYFATAAPIFEGGKYRGAVLVGLEIDDGLLAEEGQVVGWPVAYLDGRHLIRANASEELRNELTHNLPPRTEEPQLFLLQTDKLAAQFVPVTGNYNNHDVKAVLLGDRASALAPVGSVRAFIPLYGALMFLVGMGLFLWIIRTYTKPLVEIDSGIHEIMNGNHDYEFSADYRDPLWSSMAKSLNRMVGILLGRDLEEEDLEAYLGVQRRKPRTDGGAGAGGGEG